MCLFSFGFETGKIDEIEYFLYIKMFFKGKS